jgi:hypothetical protein
LRPQLKRDPLGSMRLLEMLGIIPKDQRGAIRLTDPECWRIEPTSDGARFYRALSILTRPGAILYVEGTCEREVTSFLRAHQVEHPTPIALGTVLPRPDRYHVAATLDNLRELAVLIQAHRMPLPAIHTHLYHEGRVILEWYDAFTDDPIYVSASVPEADIRCFAEALHCEYRWAEHAA